MGNFLYICKKLIIMSQSMTEDNERSGKHGFWSRALDLYVDGFRSMTVGKTLWLIIAIKLFIFFVIIKILFFPKQLMIYIKSIPC